MILQWRFSVNSGTSNFILLNMKIIITIFFGCFFCTINAQKYDNIWLLGQDSPTNPDYAGAIMDFNGDSVEVYTFFQELFFFQTNASICDTAGNLLFYTNGLKVANALGEVMENGEGINPGAYADSHQDFGYILDQGAIAIPVPESDSLYYLIHADKVTTPNPYGFHSKYVYYSLIDMSLNNGLGAVIQKNQIIREGAFEMGKLTVTHHANGVDWWLVFRRHGTNQYHRYLITANGISYQDYQIVGDSIPSPAVGQAVFSPDGSKYVNLHLAEFPGENTYVNIYDFDRCTGELFNPIQVTYIDSVWSGGVAISPNSRFLYVSSFKKVFQYDLWAANISASKDTVAIYDGFTVTSPNLASTFSLAQLAPDGKIYITCNNSVPYLHVINYPDLPGDSCEVCQHCVELPTWNAFSIPNFPNYRLGPTEEPCVTAVEAPEEVLLQEMVRVYPNPATDYLWVEALEHNASKPLRWSLYSATGQVVRSAAIRGRQQLDLPNLAPGLYFWKAQNAEGQWQTGKVVVE